MALDRSARATDGKDEEKDSRCREYSQATLQAHFETSTNGCG
jgi:hypothetical protein